MRLAGLVFLLLLTGCGSRQPPSAPTACAGLAGAASVWIQGGSFMMGDDPQSPEEGPPRPVSVPGFWMDVHEVTNAEFAAFVRATGYQTMAERAPPVEAQTPPEMRVPGSAVFSVPTADDPRWWRWAVGAEWRHPSGPAEAITGKDRYPVVQIAYEDAEAYARWAGKVLPSEAQWEYAARGGMPAPATPVNADGTPQANYYQGVFPVRDLGLDGYRSRAPVGCFPANRFGLHDMIGNVWEWTRDEGGAPGSHVIKGGSFLCASNYCARYRPAARQFQERGLGTDHIGIRLVEPGRAPPPAPDQQPHQPR
jgi:formylglycine-generating enzyme